MTNNNNNNNIIWLAKNYKKGIGDVKKKLVLLLMAFAIITSSYDSIYASADTNDKTIGVEIVGNYSKWNDLSDLRAPYNIGKGITAEISNNNKGWKTKFYLKDETVHENDFKGVSLGGNDDDYLDAVDLFIYAGHGIRPNYYGAVDYSLALNPSKGGKYAKQSEMFVGNGNLEWLVTFTCNFLASKDKDRIGHMSKGVHSICGYMDTIFLTDDMGKVFIKKLKSGMSVKQAFFETSKETRPSQRVIDAAAEAVVIGNAIVGLPAYVGNELANRINRKTAAVFTTKKNADDRIWGYGNTASDPEKYSNKTKDKYLFYTYVY